jgi:serine/threonine protein phosphatase PrpC
MFCYTVHGDQWLGMRTRQEDAFSIVTGEDEHVGAWVGLIVADGMGGHAAGDVASNTVTEVFEEVLSSSPHIDSNLLNRSLALSNQKIKSVMSECPETLGMGSTLVAAMVSRHRLDWVSVGDSPMFLLRGEKLMRLNADHSMAGAFEQMVEVGRMSREEADNDPNRHVLRSSISGEEIELIDAVTKENFLQEGDALILASDGLDVLTQAEIKQLVARNHSKGASAIVDGLLQSVRDRALPNQDNTTIVSLVFEKTNASGSQKGSERGVLNKISSWFGM